MCEAVDLPFTQALEPFDADAGIELRPQRLREWRPVDPVGFISKVRETGCPLHVQARASIRNPPTHHHHTQQSSSSDNSN